MGEAVPADRWPHTGVILAGGESRRMGAPKQDLRLRDGRRMIDAVADVLSGTCARLAVAGPRATVDAVPHVADLRPGAGPLGGIEALLASGLDEVYLVCGCDQPALTVDLLRRLALHDPDAAVAAMRLEGEETIQSLPLRVSASALSSVTDQLDAGRRALRAWLDAVACRIVEVPRACAAQLVNVNTPEDLRQL